MGKILSYNFWVPNYTISSASFFTPLNPMWWTELRLRCFQILIIKWRLLSYRPTDLDETYLFGIPVKRSTTWKRMTYFPNFVFVYIGFFSLFLDFFRFFFVFFAILRIYRRGLVGLSWFFSKWWGCLPGNRTRKK